MASLIFLIGFNWELQEFLAIIQQEREWRIFMAQHEKFYLNGTWQLKKADETLLCPVEIPGSVLSGLTEHGLLEDPFYRMNEQAYTDALTGVANKAAYKEYVDKLDKRAADEKIKYAVVVMDINNLKKINDNFGHEFGDMLIRDASRLIQKGFKDHIVYRIGGDEFVIIIEQAEKAICDELLRNFDDGIVVFNKNNTKYEQKIQIARGIAFYEPDCIDSFASVFREADHAMYENKVMQKSMQTAPPAAGQS